MAHSAQHELAREALRLKYSSTRRRSYYPSEKRAQQTDESDEHRGQPQQCAPSPTHGPSKRGLSIGEFCERYGICRSLTYVEIRRQAESQKGRPAHGDCLRGCRGVVFEAPVRWR
jgi:hypothetical protein